MGRSVEQIERDLAALEEVGHVLTSEIRSAYASYLTALGRALRQQMILASYHLCTQGYPKQFLSLSVSQRQQLQQTVRKLSQQASDQLLNHTKTEETEETEATEATEASENNSSSPHASNPIELVKWQQKLEQAIANTLKTVSYETNRLLQQAGILPKKLPAPLLEAAVNSSEDSDEAISGPPNLLNLLVETENHEDPSEDSSLTQIIAINMRLSEIEFTDTTLRAGRNKVRNLEVKARSLVREYQKKQRERAVAEAEGAWRASWFEE